MANVTPDARPLPAAPLFGRFLELALPTEDIAASVQFYERLGFRQLLTGDAWPHHYGVLSDGRIHLGLHEAATGLSLASIAPSFVLPGVARSLGALRAAGIEPEAVHFGEESLHHLQLRDPGGNPVRLQEARTFSPAPEEVLVPEEVLEPEEVLAPEEVPARVEASTSAPAQSLCGYFMHLSVPQGDFMAARSFWERAGWVALPEEDSPYPHLPLTADQLDLAFHARGGMASPFLAFECVNVPATLERLAALGIDPVSRPPRSLSVSGAALLEAPEGTLLWLLPAVQHTQRETALASA